MTDKCIQSQREWNQSSKGQELCIKQTRFVVIKTSLQVHTNRQPNTLLHPERWQKSTGCKWAKSFHQGVFKTLAPRGQDPNDWRTPTATRIDEWWHVRWTVVGKECICWVSTNQYKTSIQWWSENTSYLVWCDFFLLKNVSNLRNKQGQKYGTNQMDSVEPYTVLKLPLANQNF